MYRGLVLSRRVEDTILEPDARWQHLSYILDTAGYRALEAAGNPRSTFQDYLPGHYIKFFVLEADRASEDLETIREKLRRWTQVLRLDIHRKQWGTPSLIVLMVTTSEYRMRRIMAILDVMTKDTEPFLFKYKADFGVSLDG